MIEKIFYMEELGNELSSGLKFVAFYVFSLSILFNSYQGRHLSFSLGILQLEIGLQFSIWGKESYE